MKRKLFVIAATAILSLCGSMSVCAQPVTMEDGTVFDAEYYAQANPDVAAAFGTDADTLYLHYQLYGKAEGRLPAMPAADNMSYEKQVMELVNEQRAANGVAKLAWDDSLANAAGQRAKELTQLFSHTRPDGSRALDMISFSYRGENIAAGYPNPESVMNGWMNSPGHRSNILYTHFSKIGVGYYVDESGYPYWVQLFGG